MMSTSNWRDAWCFWITWMYKSSCWYTVSLKVTIFATGTFDIFRISVKYIFIQARRGCCGACYKKWAIIYSFQKVLRLPYVTLGVLVSPQDTTVHGRVTKTWQGHYSYPVPKKLDCRYQYNHGTVSRLHEEKCQEGWGCWARWPPPVPSNLLIVWHEKLRDQLKVKEHFSDVFNPSIQEISLEASFKNASVT